MADTETLTLTDFLLARISEDEAAARACTNRAWAWAGTSGSETVADMEHIGRHSPARVLAECQAKRRIVWLADWEGEKDSLRDRVLGPSADLAFQKGIEAALRCLAAVYADHPDCRDEWRT